MSTPQPEFLLRTIDNGRVLLLNTIAQGAFGKVYEALGPTDPSDFKRKQRSNMLCIDQLTRVYAVKELPRSNRRAYEKEAQCHQAVSDCSGVLTLYHVVEEVDATYLITDYHPDGDLCTSLQNDFALYGDSPHSRRIATNILEAVQQCHDKRVYHRDLKPDNILLADAGTRVVLADFGLSTRQVESVDFGSGSETYMSPECLAQLHCTSPYSSPSNDTWSLGIILFCIYLGFPPWARPSTSCAAFNSFLLDPDYFMRRYPLSKEFHGLLMRVFTMDPRRRISLPELISEYQGIETGSFVLTSPSAILQTRELYLRPISYPLVWDHVWRELPALLDVSKFLHERGFEPPTQPVVAESPRRSIHDQLWNPRPQVHSTPSNLDSHIQSQADSLESDFSESMVTELDLEDVEGALALAGFGPRLPLPLAPLSTSVSVKSAYWTPTTTATDLTRNTGAYFGSDSATRKYFGTGSGEGGDSEGGSSNASSELIATPVAQKLSLDPVGVVDPVDPSTITTVDSDAQAEVGVAGGKRLLDFMAGRFGTFAGAFHKHSPPAPVSRTYTPASQVFGGSGGGERRAGRGERGIHWL